MCLKLGKSPLSKLKSKHCHPTGFLHGNPRHVPREFDASMRAAALQRLNGGTMDLALVRSSGKIGRSNGAATRGSGVKGGMLGVGSWVKVIVFFKPTKYTLVLFFFGLLVNMIYIYTCLLIPKTYAILAKAVNLLIPIRSSRPFIAQSFIE